MQAIYESSIFCFNGKLLSLKISLKMLIVAPGLKRLKKKSRSLANEAEHISRSLDDVFDYFVLRYL